MTTNCKRCGKALPKNHHHFQVYHQNGVCNKHVPLYDYTPMDWQWLGLVRYYDDKIAVARKNGFENLTEFLRACYWQWESCSAVGKYLGMSQLGALLLLTKAGCEIGPRGGKRFAKK